MQAWALEPGRLLVAGAFSDLALHHHPAIQITVGGCGPLTVSCDGDTQHGCRLVVIASGARHAVRSDAESGALTLYLGLQTPQGNAVNALSRNHGQRQGIWIVAGGQTLAEATAGFADGSHANKVCWEMTGATPRELADAVRRSLI